MKANLIIFFVFDRPKGEKYFDKKKFSGDLLDPIKIYK